MLVKGARPAMTNDYNESRVREPSQVEIEAQRQETRLSVEWAKALLARHCLGGLSREGIELR